MTRLKISSHGVNAIRNPIQALLFIKIEKIGKLY